MEPRSGYLYFRQVNTTRENPCFCSVHTSPQKKKYFQHTKYYWINVGVGHRAEKADMKNIDVYNTVIK